MSRLNSDLDAAVTGKPQEQLNAVRAKLGMVPNMMREMAKAPSVLDAYLQFSGALAHSSLSSKLREQISLAVAEANGCDYCLAAHTAIGSMVGLTSEQILDSRVGTAIDSKTDALLQFVKKVVIGRGQVSDDDVQEFRDAGFADTVIAEIVACIALDLFTNYFNLVVETEIDFPRAPALTQPAVAVH